MNKVIMIGNLTKDPDVRTTGTGKRVCTLSIAVQRRFGDKGGEIKADFFNVIAWSALAEICGKYLKKGSKVAVSGTVQNRSYEAKDGTKRFVTEVIAEEVEFLTKNEEKVQKDEAQRGNWKIEYGDPVDDALPF